MKSVAVFCSSSLSFIFQAPFRERETEGGREGERERKGKKRERERKKRGEKREEQIGCREGGKNDKRQEHRSTLSEKVKERKIFSSLRST